MGALPWFCGTERGASRGLCACEGACGAGACWGAGVERGGGEEGVFGCA